MPGLYFLEADGTLDKCEFLCTGHLSKTPLFCVLCPGLVEISSAFRVLSPYLSNKKQSFLPISLSILMHVPPGQGIV